MILNNTITATAIANATITAAKMASGAVNDADYIVGNEISNVASGRGLVRSGSGTASSPYLVGIQDKGVTGDMIATMGAIDGAIMKYNGSTWSPGLWSFSFVVNVPSPGTAGSTFTVSNSKVNHGSMCAVSCPACVGIEEYLNGSIRFKMVATHSPGTPVRLSCLSY